MPFALTGCTVYCEVQSYVASGKGGVYIITNGTYNSGESIVGRVEKTAKDKNFKYAVAPNNGWKIVSIKQNGQLIYHIDNEESQNVVQPDENGVARCNIEKVTDDCKIEVEFAVKNITLTFMYKDTLVTGGYSTLKNDDQSYTLSVTADGCTLTGFTEFGFEFKLVTDSAWAKLTQDAQLFYHDVEFRTDKTESELKEFLNQFNA